MKKESLAVKAVVSGKKATSGKLIVQYRGLKKEIPAVVFSRAEIIRSNKALNGAFSLIDKTSKSIRNHKPRFRIFRIAKKSIPIEKS